MRLKCIVKPSQAWDGEGVRVLGEGGSVVGKLPWPECLGMAWDDCLHLPGPQSSLQPG